MKANELLLKHQLNVAHYWEQKVSGPELGGPSEKLPRLANEPSVPTKWTLTQGIGLHDWQKECLEKWIAAGRHGVVKVVTGAGKTVFALAAAETLQNTEQPDLLVAIVVPTIVLMDQWYDAIIQFGNLPGRAVRRVGGGHSDDFTGDARVLITVLASAQKLLAEKTRNMDPGRRMMLIVDECHRAGAEQMSRIFSAPFAFSLGLSATPERETVTETTDEEGDARDETEVVVAVPFDESKIGKALGPIIYELTFAQAIERGILPRFAIQHYGLPLAADERSIYERVSRDITELRRTLQNYNSTTRALGGGALVGWARKAAGNRRAPISATAAEYVELTSRRKSIVYRAKAREAAVFELLRREFSQNENARVILFHESIAEVMRLFGALREQQFRVVPEHSELSDSLRAESIELFRKGIAQVLVSARSLIEGFDVPAADVGIVVASSSSIRQRIQTLGRILRKHQTAKGTEKHAALQVLYMAGTVDELIYEKTDWNRVIGADRNSYFVWSPSDGVEPIAKEGPPRLPLMTELQIDWSRLKIGDIYPGAYEGLELSCDSLGNVTDSEKHVARNPQNVAAMLKKVTGRVGRFKITPQKLAVLIRMPEKEGSWITKLAGFLGSAFDFQRMPAESTSQALSGLEPGDEYSGEVGKGEEFRLKQRANGAVIALKVRGGEVFARTGSQARDPKSGEDAERVVRAAQAAASKEGQWIPRFRINEKKHAFYLSHGRARFLCALEKGLEFPEGEG
jgi:superfamily II DNA or RNA helicase